MKIIGKISKGSKMDQVYIPKNRACFSIGEYVIIKSLEEKKSAEKLYFYGIKSLEPLKLSIINEIIRIIDSNLKNCENIIVTGSFLDKGFQFNDIDIIVITEDKISAIGIKEDIEKKIGIKAHILTLSNKTFIKGLETDPIYQMFLSKCISKNRFVYKIKHKIDYKLLDLHLLKSKILIDNFDILSGNEKYDLIRNMFAIYLYLENRKISKELIDAEIKKNLGFKDIGKLKQNLIDKKTFLKKCRVIYNKTFAKILRGIEDGAKQK